MIALGAITTPAACTEAWRVIPSRRLATASSSLTFGSVCSISRSGSLSSSAFSQRHVERRRNLLRDLVDVGERHFQHAADVAHHRLRLHRPEGDDLGDVLAAVLAGDVLDHLAAAPLAEVDVDVGQRHALGVEEALEDQIEVDRVDVGDPHAVGDQAAGGGAAAGADRDAALAGVADEVPDDQEVPGYFICLIISSSYARRRSYSSTVCRSVPASASCCSRGSRCAKPSRATFSK